ncbi:TPA: VanW family protein [Corynebacterium striatum]|uniref:VanW family protein n=1 Tax=Corynebacterium striatum TaxID=43770 RepID=UPI000673CAD4|nr:VanW family protein [Corynebacterium striatum]CQD05183.1 VanW family protein [Corynebacterium striatum]HCD2524329.1 VanW family protein [Corynebacterium striatum]HCD3162331.1 VanW family protein [Corynebacterium striatum]HCD3683463.1 VanW family protein [Corynebacterium striatum]HCD4757072.1 VanW family protein [Corynebacterium striatum]
MKKAVGQQTGKGWRITLGVIVGLLLIAGIAYTWDVIANQGKVPRATSVGGVDISSMERTAAVEKLERELGDVETKPVNVTSGEKSSQLVPAESGLTLNYQKAVDGIPDASYNPVTRLFSFVKATQEIPVAVDIDDTALDGALERVKNELSFAPKDGMLELNNGQLKVTKPVLGQTVEPDDLKNSITENWLDPAGVEVEPVEVEPAINDDAIEAMRTGDVAKALDNPLTINGENNVAGTLRKDEIAQFVSIEAKDAKLELKVDTPKAQQLFEERMDGAQVPGQNAKISFSGDKMNVTPSVDGSIIDWEKTLKDFDKRVKGDERTWDADYKPDPAEYTTEMAEKATFNDTVSEFSTGGFSGASGENIRRVAAQVDGAVVNPGETFSLNGYTGPRGTAQGYVESGIIINGHSGTAVGGGISQFATTLYNAAYFAGFEDVAHTPHSYYISRYPAGREATVYEGSIDLQFKNTTNTPVRIETDFGGGKITVRFKGVKTYNVESVNNGRWATTQPTRMSVGEDCSPSSGAPGFTTSDTRIIKDLSGREVSRETTTTVYDPQPIVSCG